MAGPLPADPLPELPPIGRPIAGTICLVLDPQGNLAPIGIPGELCLGGANVAAGYLSRPALTASVFVPPPNDVGLPEGSRVYRTGDRCYWDEQGRLHYLGRNDDQVKVRGFRVEPGEVAAILTAHPEIIEAVVVPCVMEGRTLLAAYMISENEVAPEALTTWLRERLPAHMIPEYFLRMDSFPLSANGKLDRKALPAPQKKRPATALGSVAPGTGVERQISEIWKAALGIESVGIHDNFFESGGNSFSLIEVHGRLKEAFGEPLPVVKLFEHATIASLAAYLSDREVVKSGHGAERGKARKAARSRRRRR